MCLLQLVSVCSKRIDGTSCLLGWHWLVGKWHNTAVCIIISCILWIIHFQNIAGSRNSYIPATIHTGVYSVSNNTSIGYSWCLQADHCSNKNAWNLLSSKSTSCCFIFQNLTFSLLSWNDFLLSSKRWFSCSFGFEQAALTCSWALVDICWCL